MCTILELLNEAAATADDLERTFEDRCSVLGRKGQVIYDAGDATDTVYVLASGFARAYVGEGLATRTVTLIQAPAIVGDRDVLSGQTTTRDSVRLMTKACLFAFSRQDFMAQWHASPELRELLAVDLTYRYALTLRWMALDASEASDRVAQLKSALGKVEPSTATLASMLGLSRRSIFRALAELRARGPAADDEEPVMLIYRISSTLAQMRRAVIAAGERANAAA